ncbi:MAG TPA: toprim domain-containing protein [Abditibacterium sp.]|jgi:hypothetical protein
MERPILSLREIDDFDPQGPPQRKWCPLCGDGKPKDGAHRCLSIERQNGLWKCFRCGASGQAREFWEDKPILPTRERNRAHLRAAFSLTPTESVSAKAEVSPLHTGMAQIRPEIPVEPLNQPTPVSSDWQARWGATKSLENTDGEDYLRGRGISLATAQLAGVRWSHNWSGQGAVVFPICAPDGVVVAAQGRAIRGNAKLTAGPKKDGAFFAPVQTQSGRVFAPLDADLPAIILTEAPIDALSLAKCGFPALALCGTNGPRWLHLVCGLRRVILAFDADEAGERAYGEIQRQMAPFGARCERLRPQGAKDWNEWLQNEGADTLSDFLVVSMGN